MQKRKIPVPHYSCICKRAKRREVPNYIKGKKITDVVFDTSKDLLSLFCRCKNEKYLYHTIVAFVKEQKEERSLNIKGKKIIDVVFDTSGVRIYEAGEWKKETYGSHRKWRKLHVAIDLATKEIVYSKLTSDSTHDLHHIDDVMKTLNRKKGNVLTDGIADQHKLRSANYTTNSY